MQTLPNKPSDEVLRTASRRVCTLAKSGWKLFHLLEKDDDLQQQELLLALMTCNRLQTSESGMPFSELCTKKSMHQGDTCKSCKICSGYKCFISRLQLSRSLVEAALASPEGETDSERWSARLWRVQDNERCLYIAAWPINLLDTLRQGSPPFRDLFCPAGWYRSKKKRK